jgi:Delta7-sterol 5-desaturase
MALNSPQSETAKKDIWNHRGPVVLSPLFDWPLQPVAALLALTKRWVTVTRNVLFLALAICVYNYFLPDLTEMTALSLAWIVPMFLRNVALFLLVAGGLHWYLYVLRGQGKTLKFDPREQQEKSNKFLFKDQVKDNIFWSIASGASIWTAYEVLYFWGVANQVIPVLEFSSHPIEFFVWLLVFPALLSTHFYFIHRLLHVPALYFRFHRLHHSNIHIGPWSGMSMHPVEHILYISSVLIHYIIPSHPVILLLHLFNRCLAPAFSHAGFEKLVIKDKVITEAADFHHQLHHKFFECNYGNVDTAWDRWLGTLHDGSDESTELVNERRHAMYADRRASKA